MHLRAVRSNLGISDFKMWTKQTQSKTLKKMENKVELLEKISWECLKTNTYKKIRFMRRVIDYKKSNLNTFGTCMEGTRHE